MITRRTRQSVSSIREGEKEGPPKTETGPLWGDPAPAPKEETLKSILLSSWEAGNEPRLWGNTKNERVGGFLVWGGGGPAQEIGRSQCPF